MDHTYRVEEFCTTGWELIQDNLSRSEASELLQNLLDEGTSPDRLRAVRDS